MKSVDYKGALSVESYLVRSVVKWRVGNAIKHAVVIFQGSSVHSSVANVGKKGEISRKRGIRLYKRKNR
jgi:hypothetical protein